MPTFSSNRYRPPNATAHTLSERLTESYRRQLSRRPFLLFGLPFLSLIVAASFLLTPATALRYERHDRKNRQLTRDEALELGLRGSGIGTGTGTEGEKNVAYNPRRRKVTVGGTSERDEYYRLMAKDLDSWEQKRVERWKGEPDGRM